MPVSMFVHACVWACLCVCMPVCMPVCMHVWLKGSNMPCLFTQQLGIKYGAPLKQCRHLLKVASDLGLDVVGVRYAIIILPGSIKGTIIMCYNHFDCSFMLWFQQVMMLVGLLLYIASWWPQKTVCTHFVSWHGPFESLRTIIGCDEPTCPQWTVFKIVLIISYALSHNIQVCDLVLTTYVVFNIVYGFCQQFPCGKWVLWCLCLYHCCSGST